MKKLRKYFKVWWLMSKNSFMGTVNQRFVAFAFLLGKLIRFGFFLVFIVFLLGGVKNLVGYSLNQTIFFFLTFNLIDIVSQFLFREVYRFRPLIVSGSFDLVLVKPVSALFRSLMGGADILDLITIPPLVVAIFVVARSLGPTPLNVLYYVLLLANGMLIATAFYIAVLALGIVTLEIDHTIMIYRDLSNLARFPIDIYKEPLKGILTYLIPIGIMVSLPAKAMMGFVSLKGFLLSLLLGITLIFLAVRFWHFALTKYSSASS
jgi:ABC-2 type transport system permease protein